MLAGVAPGLVEGVIAAHGSHSGGWVFYLHGRRLHYAYNFVGTEITVASASVELPAGCVMSTRTALIFGEGIPRRAACWAAARGPPADSRPAPD